MVKKEVVAILVALLFVATLAAGVASAKGVAIGRGYNGSSDDFFTSVPWNGSFWDYVAEKGELEAVREAREAAKADAEKNLSFWDSGDKTPRPAGYWDIDPNYKEKSFPSYSIRGYWDVKYGFPWP